MLSSVLNLLLHIDMWRFFWTWCICVVCFLLRDSSASEFYMPTFRNTLFYLHRQVGACRMNSAEDMFGVLYGKRFGLEMSWAIRPRGGQSRGRVRVQKQAVKGNDPHGGSRVSV